MVLSFIPACPRWLTVALSFSPRLGLLLLRAGGFQFQLFHAALLISLPLTEVSILRRSTAESILREPAKLLFAVRLSWEIKSRATPYHKRNGLRLAFIKNNIAINSPEPLVNGQTPRMPITQAYLILAAVVT